MIGLAVENLTVRFGQTTAVDDVSLRVEAAEIVALLGPSGCGKSTLLRVIAGLEPPHGGSVSWNGDDLAPLAPEERSFGLMFQDHALFPHRNVADNVAFGLKMKGKDKAQQRTRVGDILELVDLASFGDRRVDSLSGGEAQRVALARALAPSPQLLMLDEPLGSLDRSLRDRLAVDIRSVLKELGQSAIHVTHDQDEAFTVADRILLMKDGKILRQGSPQELWLDPQTRFAAEFLGHPNILEDASRFGGPPGPAVLRTEAISIHEPTADGLAATVTTLSFRGDHFRVAVDLDTGEELVALAPTAPASPGQRVSLVVATNGFSPLTT